MLFTVVEVGGKRNIPPLQRVLNAFGIPYIVVCDLHPGDETTAKNLTRIRELIAEANAKHGNIAREDVYDPNVPAVCHGKPPEAGQRKYSSFDALVLVRDGTPTAAFCERVKALFRIP
ncbi:MAG: TOPRIM nucleotidyl transferase/hydrolase domain-containing protein [Phycisphaerales bacterium]